jgi:hypothetical protein
MLIHLNGFLNSKQAPDENYAREFQELFTIGVGNDSHYTENDVISRRKGVDRLAGPGRYQECVLRFRCS